MANSLQKGKKEIIKKIQDKMFIKEILTTLSTLILANRTNGKIK